MGASEKPIRLSYVVAVLITVSFVLATSCRSVSHNRPDLTVSASRAAESGENKPATQEIGSFPTNDISTVAPDFTLPSIQGPEYKLSDFRGKQPVVIVFYRAYW